MPKCPRCGGKVFEDRKNPGKYLCYKCRVRMDSTLTLENGAENGNARERASEHSDDAIDQKKSKSLLEQGSQDFQDSNSELGKALPSDPDFDSELGEIELSFNSSWQFPDEPAIGREIQVDDEIAEDPFISGAWTETPVSNVERESQPNNLGKVPEDKDSTAGNVLGWVSVFIAIFSALFLVLSIIMPINRFVSFASYCVAFFAAVIALIAFIANVRNAGVGKKLSWVGLGVAGLSAIAGAWFLTASIDTLSEMPSRYGNVETRDASVEQNYAISLSRTQDEADRQEGIHGYFRDNIYYNDYFGIVITDGNGAYQISGSNKEDGDEEVIVSKDVTLEAHPKNTMIGHVKENGAAGYENEEDYLRHVVEGGEIVDLSVGLHPVRAIMGADGTLAIVKFSGEDAFLITINTEGRADDARVNGILANITSF